MGCGAVDTSPSPGLLNLLATAEVTGTYTFIHYPAFWDSRSGPRMFRRCPYAHDTGHAPRPAPLSLLSGPNLLESVMITTGAQVETFPRREPLYSLRSGVAFPLAR